MIKHLQSVQEIITFKENTQTLLYHNRRSINYPSHWHTPFELIIPTKNSYNVICAGTCYELQEGDILIISPGTIHELLAPAKGERIIFQIYIEVTSVKDLDSVINRISPCTHLRASSDSFLYFDVRALMQEIEDIYLSATPLCTLSIYTKFLQILLLLGKHSTKKSQHIYAESSLQEDYTKKFTSICIYIAEHCTEEISLETISALAGFSKYHFSRLFKQFTNLTFYKYLSLKRIAYAQTLLMNPEISITDAALQSGFSSATSFIRMFKLINDCTPTEFRKMRFESLHATSNS